MTPIESKHDTRLITLVGVCIDAIEELSLLQNVDPESLLAEYLYKNNKKLHEVGEEIVLEKLESHYPILEEAMS